MNREAMVTHLHQLLQRMQKAGRTYREALEWDAFSAEHTKLEYAELDETILYKYDVVTDSYHGISTDMSNQILQYVVKNWDAIKPHVLEDLRKTWLDVENEYLTCLEELRAALDDDKPHNKIKVLKTIKLGEKE